MSHSKRDYGTVVISKEEMENAEPLTWAKLQEFREDLESRLIQQAKRALEHGIWGDGTEPLMGDTHDD